MTVGQGKYVDNLKLRKFTGNTSVYSTNYSNMSITANALDGWAPDNWSTTSATVDQAAGQYRLVAIGTGATAKVQREFTAMPNQEHRFQYNLSLLNGGSTTVRVEQKVNGVYQYLATQQTQTSSGTYELSFVPNYQDIRISFSGTSRYALNNLYLDRDQIDTLVSTYALSRGYRYGFNGMEKDDEVKGAGNSVNYTYRMHDPRLGRFFAVDPLFKDYPWNSPYAFSENNVIHAVELEGLEKFFSIDGSFIGAGDINDKRKMLVLKPATATSVKGMTNEARVEFLQTKPFDVVLAPNSKMIGMLEMIQKKEYSKEFGFAYGVRADGTYVFSSIVESKGNNLEIDLGPAIFEIQQMEGVTLLGLVHSHPTDYLITKKGPQPTNYPITIEPGSLPIPSDIDYINQSNRMASGLVQQAGIVLGQTHEVVPDLMTPSPAYGQQPTKVKTLDKITFYGGREGEKVELEFKKIKETSGKIEKSKD